MMKIRTRIAGRQWRIQVLGLVALLTLSTAQATMALNPDVRQRSIGSTICTPGYTQTVRPSTAYTNGVKKRLMKSKGLSLATMSHYELDHIVPLALGGHPRSFNNLMLQPWDGKYGAHKKDRLEVKLQCLVCTGEIPLTTAQRAIYQDWQKAYRQYAQVKCHRPKMRRR